MLSLPWMALSGHGSSVEDAKALPPCLHSPSWWVSHLFPRAGPLVLEGMQVPLFAMKKERVLLGKGEPGRRRIGSQ